MLRSKKDEIGGKQCRANVQSDGAATLPDGVYQVFTPSVCAGFVVQDGHVAHCAPILRRRFSYWLRFAKRVTLKTEDT